MAENNSFVYLSIYIYIYVVSMYLLTVLQKGLKVTKVKRIYHLKEL